MMNTDKTLVFAFAVACAAMPVMATDVPPAADTATLEPAAARAPQAGRVRVRDRAAAAAAVAAISSAESPPTPSAAPAAADPVVEHAAGPTAAEAPVATAPEAGEHGTAPVPAAAEPAPVATAEAATRAAECNPPFKSEVVALFDRWNASLRTGDPKKVVAHYAPGSVLLPTVSNRVRFTVAEKEEYFAHFLQRSPEGRIDDRVIDVDCNSATDSGLYTFRFADGTQAKARYTFTWKRIEGEWLIVSHHSSGMPEKPEPAADPKTAKAASKTMDGPKAWVRFP